MSFQLPKFNSRLQKIINISQKNKAFKELSEEDKRKEVAYDCLILVQRDKLIALDCLYWMEILHDCLTLNGQRQRISAKQVCKSFHSLPDLCGVCIRGALMVSILRLNGGQDVTTNCYGRLIQQSINCGDIESIKGFNILSFKKMEEFFMGEQEISSKINLQKRLTDILINVIVNGDFDKDDCTNYLKKNKIIL